MIFDDLQTFKNLEYDPSNNVIGFFNSKFKMEKDEQLTKADKEERDKEILSVQ